MLDNKPKPRIPIPRTVRIEVKDEGEQGWAVSYADLLMVLLSFFILFFSVDDGKKESLIQRLAVSINDKSGKSSERNDLGSAQAGAMDQSHGRTLASLSKDLKMKTSLAENQLIIELPENLFPNGVTTPFKESRDVITSVFTKLLPYADKINFTIVGHTDQTPMKGVKAWLQDNIDLSARRATEAYKIAKTVGFNEEQIDIRASGPHQRNSRSISIIIQEKAGKL